MLAMARISFAPIEKVQRMITDVRAPASDVAVLRARGVDVMPA